MLTLALLFGCSTQGAVIEGRVQDIWNNPVEGATVMLVGGTERPLTDASGRYEVPRMEGTHLMKAGRMGYIQEHVELVVAAGETPPGPTFTLHPKPDGPGLYLVQRGAGSYHRLTPARVRSVGNALRAYRGIDAVGEALAESASPAVVFHTDLRHDELMRLGLTLHRLDYVRTAMVPSSMGDTEVQINRYIAAEEVDIELRPLRSKTDYLIEISSLEPGVYAFQTQDMLQMDPPAFDAIPDELRVIFPFEVR